MFPTIYRFKRFNYFITWQIEKSNTWLNFEVLALCKWHLYINTFSHIIFLSLRIILITKNHFVTLLYINSTSEERLCTSSSAFFSILMPFFFKHAFDWQTFTFYWYQLFIFWLYISPILVSIMCLLLYLPIKMCMLPLNCICVPFEINTV